MREIKNEWFMAGMLHEYLQDAQGHKSIVDTLVRCALPILNMKASNIKITIEEVQEINWRVKLVCTGGID